ncbi:MAG TPA: alpha/beta fold hydrolase [Candidatus Baltobacteraceae bacterium]|nr:alpha/beta fold hydrolase [Candidatus Baltobacteraceae bacterium]
MLQAPRVDPARSYAQALQRVRALAALDDERILPQARTALLDHGERAPLAVVLLHGFTNHPGQYREFAPLVHARGANVLIPRMPEQGDRDRLTRRMSRLTAESLLERASAAVDAACGLGERVCVAGISSSGLLCAYLAQYRSDVARAVAIAPVFAMLHLPYAASAALTHVLLAIPDMYLWWDPRLKEQQRPASAYPWFSTHALAQTMRVGENVYARARREAPAGRSVVMMTNRHDPAVNNDVTHDVARAWEKRRAGSVREFQFTDLPRNHDIIEPDNPNARTDVVYPRLLEFVMGTCELPSP